MAMDKLRLVIERWSRPGKPIEYRWSVWHAGKRAGMGGPHASAEDSEIAAQTACRASVGREADIVERL